MSPNTASSTGKDKLIADEEEVLQAVILADSFNKRFKPLTTHKPRCLLPICNAPLLDWTFESLALAGVQEIFVICRSHAELVKTAIKNSKWSKPGAGLKIVPIVTAKETFTPGDAMRDIYTHGIIASDFVLVTGDLVSNIHIGDVVREHKERRKTDKDAIMTMVVKQSGVNHRTRSRGDSAVFVIDPETSKCLHYEAVTGYPPKKYASIPREILNEHPEVEIRNDLIDCSIDICSVEVRTCKIGNNTLIGSKSQIADNAQVTASVLGQRCVVGAGSIVRNSYLFDGAVVGPNCVVEHSIIGSGVHIKERTRVERGCLIADGVVVGPQAKLAPFSRLSKRRQDSDEEDEEFEDAEEECEEDDGAGEDGDDEDEVDSELEDVEANQDPEALAKLGSGTNAIIWPLPAVDEDEDIDELEHPDNQRLMRIGDSASDLVLSDPGSITSSESESESDDDDDDEHFYGSNPASSTTSLPLSTPSNLVAQADSAVISEFQQEVKQSLDRAFAEGHSVDNAAVELKTLRMASNVSLRLVREAVIAAIVSRIKIMAGGGIPQRQEIASMIARWGGLIDKIGGVDPVETVEILQEYCASSDRLPLFGQILAALYQDDIVDEDDIRAWHGNSKSQGQGVKPTSLQDNYNKCWVTGAHMIKQFDEQDSDEDSEEDSDDGAESTDPAVKNPVTKELPSAGANSLEENSCEESSDEEDEGDTDEDDSE
ncbi:nucleotide-diphospho-sugar transferase [Suillus americanus]|nr:nucleotide-diphospho-sugar transferase [Suillus americanus]